MCVLVCRATASVLFLLMNHFCVFISSTSGKSRISQVRKSHGKGRGGAGGRVREISPGKHAFHRI